MPFTFKFSDCILDSIKSIEISPVGWKNPIIIEYGLAQVNKYDTSISVVWHIKGTNHTFTIFEQRINVLSRGDYKKHFTEVLENFRIDYLSWFTEDRYKDAVWKEEYKKEFEQYIIK